MADQTEPLADPLILPLAEPLRPDAPADRRHGTTWAENAPFALMMVITLGLFGSIGMLMFHSVPPDNHDILIGVTSSIATVWIAGGAYFFGSTASAKTKDTAIATLAAKAPTGETK